MGRRLEHEASCLKETMLSKELVALITVGITANAFTLTNIVSCGSHVLRRPSKRHHEQASPYSRILPLRRAAAIPGSFEAAESDGEGALSGVYERSYGSLTGAVRMCTGGSGEARGSYVDVTVREAVEWTMGANSEFHYIDIRSPEEHEILSPPRGSVGIPAFEPVSLPQVEGDGTEEDEAGGKDYEQVEWRPMPDFVERVKSQFSLDSKLLVGCRTRRSAMACQMLVDAGFIHVYNVESRSFVRMPKPDAW